MTRFGELLRVLSDFGVDFIVIGGVAAVAHGSARATQDIDIIYRRGSENLERLASALSPLNPQLRGAPAGLPFRLDAATLSAGMNFTLVTTLGWIDLLGEIAGNGTYETLISHCIGVKVFGFECRILDLPTLIATKKAAGRPRDLEAIAELEILAERLGPH